VRDGRLDQAVVVVVDDDHAVRAAVGDLLRSAGFEVQLFGSAQELLEQAMPNRPHCLVLDVHLPGLSGLDLQERLVELRTGTPIVFLTAHGDIPMSVRAMKAGAFEFLTKPPNDVALIDGVRRAIERSVLTREHDRELHAIRERYAALTPRQREVMVLVTKGLLNKQVAAELGITEIMVKVHRRHVMAKMEAGSLPNLVRIADRLDLRDRSD
jgi:FixJ family two-component response regulator